MREFRHDAVEVTDEPTPVCVLPQDVGSVLVRNVGTSIVYLGGPQVCVPSDDEDAGPQGFPLKPDEWFPVSAIEYDVGTLYAVTRKSGTVVFLAAS
jgi:hypothetical protein